MPMRFPTLSTSFLNLIGLSPCLPACSIKATAVFGPRVRDAGGADPALQSKRVCAERTSARVLSQLRLEKCRLQDQLSPALLAAAKFFARRSSPEFCKFTQDLGVVLKCSNGRNAESSVTPGLPISTIATRFKGNPSVFETRWLKARSRRALRSGFRRSAPASWRSCL